MLGSLLHDPQMCDEVALILPRDDFYADANQKLYGHLLALHDDGKRVDTTLLTERLRHAGQFEAIGGRLFAEVLIGPLRRQRHALCRKLSRESDAAPIHAGTEILREAWDPGMKRSRGHQPGGRKSLRGTRPPQQQPGEIIYDVMVEAFERIDARLERGEGGGIPTGFHDLDRLTGGLHGSELVILAARPSMGNTALATNIAEYVTKFPFIWFWPEGASGCAIMTHDVEPNWRAIFPRN